MIEMSKNVDEEEEELRRRFLFRALFLEQKRPGQSIAETISKNAVHSSDNKDMLDDDREHGRGSRKYMYTKVALISQLDTWDCGIACLLMIAHWLRDEYREHDYRCDDNFWNDGDGNGNGNGNGEDCHETRMTSEQRAKLLSDVGTESIWTSDLMVQLQSWKTKKMAVAKESETEAWFLPSPWSLAAGITGTTRSEESSLVFVLSSMQVMDADESYRDFQYYQNAFEEDQSRVAIAFRDLHHQEVPMLQTTTNFRDDGKQKRGGRGLSLSTVIDIVHRDDCLAIVLLDNCVLLATSQNPDSSLAPMANHRPPYAGHYVVLCGTSNEPRHVEIANSGESNDHRESVKGDKCDEQNEGFCFVLCNPDPSSTVAGSNYMFVTPKRLEASWRAQGTDEDIIFLRKATKCKEATTTEPHGKGFLLASGTTINSYEIIGDGNVRNMADDHHLSARIQDFVRENYVALTGLLRTLYKHHFPPFCRH
jgi:hypothetical protein